MTLIESWKKNIAMLQPQNLKNLGLLSLKMVKDNVISIIVIALSCMAMHFLIPTLLIKFFKIFSLTWNFLKPFVGLSGSFIMVLTISLLVLVFRSSVKKKDWRYFYSYLLSALFFSVLIASLGYFLVKYFFGLIKTPVFIMTILAALFFFDREKQNYFYGVFYSLYQSVKFFVYNLPVCGLTGLVTSIFFYIMYSLLVMVFGVLGMLMFIGNLFFDITVIAILTTVYNTLIYEQRSLYFKS